MYAWNVECSHVVKAAIFVRCAWVDTHVWTKQVFSYCSSLCRMKISEFRTRWRRPTILEESQGQDTVYWVSRSPDLPCELQVRVWQAECDQGGYVVSGAMCARVFVSLCEDILQRLVDVFF